MKFLLSIALCLYSIVASSYPRCSSLAKDSLTKIKTGEIFSVEVEMDNEPWPQITLYALVKTSPQKAMTLFTDFNTHSEYFPNITESKILKGPIENIPLKTKKWEVAYTMKTPWPLMDEKYQLVDTLKEMMSQDKKTFYQLDWLSTQTTQVNKITGQVVFEQIDDWTCMSYTNLVSPAAIPGLSLLKSQAVERAQDAVKAFQQRAQGKL